MRVEHRVSLLNHGGMATKGKSARSILVVGAGAVGQVYGRHLQLGGAQVTFYMRAKYRADAEKGYPMYPLNKQGRDKPVRFGDFGIVTDKAEVAAAGPFDEVWLCVSSPALRGQWLEDVIDSAGGKATIVMLTSGFEDRKLLASLTGEERIVAGMISMISYHGPLPDETLPEPGVVYWFPPLGPSPFHGPKERTRAVVDGLRAGKCPAKVSADVEAAGSFGAAVLMPHLLALEANNWRFDGLKRGDWLRKASAATKEALAATAAHLGTEPPLAMKFINPMALRVIMAASKHVIPLPIETYLAYHFTKVGDQTRAYINDYVASCIEHQLPSDALGELCKRLDAVKPKALTSSAKS